MSFTDTAKRWADKCIYCGTLDQRIIVASVCVFCRDSSKKNNDKKSVLNDNKKYSK